MLLEVHEEGEVVEDGEGQVEGRNQGEMHMDDYADGMRLKNTLSHEVHVTQTSKERRRLRARACSHVVQLARVGVRVIVLVVDVVCLIVLC